MDQERSVADSVNERVLTGVLNALVDFSHSTATEKGWHDEAISVQTMREAYLEDETIHLRRHADRIAGMLLMVVDEVLEATDHVRKMPPTDLGSIGFDLFKEQITGELADIVIRVADVAGWLEVDLGKAVADKLNANKDRPQRHGGKLL